MTTFKIKSPYFTPEYDRRIGTAVIDLPEVTATEAPVALVSRNTSRMVLPYRWFDGRLWVPSRRPGGKSEGLLNSELKDIGPGNAVRVDKVDKVEMSDAFLRSDAWRRLEARVAESILIEGEPHTRTRGPLLVLEHLREGSNFRWTDSPLNSWGHYPRINAFTYREVSLGRSIGNASSGQQLLTLGEDPEILMDVDDGCRSFDAAIESGCWFTIDAIKKRHVEDLTPEAIEAMVKIRTVLSERVPDTKFNSSSTHLSMNGNRGIDLPDASELVGPLSILATFLRPTLPSWGKITVDTLSERIAQTPFDRTNEEALSMAFT